MKAALTFTDHQRAGRALIGWLDSDRLAVDAVMHEVGDDPAPEAVAAMVFAVVQLAGEVLTTYCGDSVTAAANSLRAALGSLTTEAIARGELPR
jgi:hypothetical protein